MRFEDYHIVEEVKKNLAKLGFKRPTDIQFKAIPAILKGEDVLAIAQTGTGKTAAFAIPVINNLHIKKNLRRPDGIRCIVMVPTRELAIQITEVLEELCRHTLVKAFCVFGGVEQGPQIAKLQDGYDILVATPGRLFDLESQGHLRLNRVHTLILDEADHMLALGFIKDIRQLITKLPPKRQTLFFSATIDDEIKKLAYSLVHKPIRIQVSPKDPVSKNVNHSVAFVDMDDKRFFLEHLIKENPEQKVLVFVRTKVRAERVFKAMERVQITTMTIHGDKDQEDRFIAMESFKKGEVKVLIATDVSARGIDIPKVDVVINYDMPEVAENYVHRVGRTGRGTEKGMAIAFCSEEERPILEEIEGFINNEITRQTITKGEYIEIVAAADDGKDDWKTLIKDSEDFNAKKKKKKKNRH